MAVQRDNPYGAFRFRVTADRLGDAGTVRAGFQDISGLSREVAIAEYRNGNERANHVRKMNGLTKAGDVTLKRGLIGYTDLYDWIKAVGDGDQSVFSLVTIELMDEAGTNAVMTWKLTNARPMKYTGPTLAGKGGTDVAMEELVLSVEDLTIE
jgi:phage tail-like protein